jgi:hypothetical protein
MRLLVNGDLWPFVFALLKNGSLMSCARSFENAMYQLCLSFFD